MSILMVCCHCSQISSCDQVSCKAHKVGKRLHKVFAPIGLELLVAMAHGQHKASIDIKTLKGE